jgi:hypothetical protein
MCTASSSASEEYNVAEDSFDFSSTMGWLQVLHACCTMERMNINHPKDAVRRCPGAVSYWQSK